MQKRDKLSISTHVKVVISLIIIQFPLDMLYVYIYPSVNPIRATFIGISALIILSIPIIRNFLKMNPLISFLPIYSSALFGALLVQAGFVASKSTASGITHVLILIITYVIIALIRNPSNKKSS